MIALLLALLATVPVTNNSKSYACTGITATYAIDFPYLAYTDLIVTSTTGPGVVTTLAYTTDYTVNRTSTTTTATLTLNNPAAKCPGGSTLKILRSLDNKQPYGFRGQTTYDTSLHETAYDRIVMLIQQAVNGGAIAGVGLASVLADSPILGTGTTADHLRWDFSVANTWTGRQTFSAASGAFSITANGPLGGGGSAIIANGGTSSVGLTVNPAPGRSGAVFNGGINPTGTATTTFSSGGAAAGLGTHAIEASSPSGLGSPPKSVIFADAEVGFPPCDALLPNPAAIAGCSANSFTSDGLAGYAQGPSGYGVRGYGPLAGLWGKGLSNGRGVNGTGSGNGFGGAFFGSGSTAVVGATNATGLVGIGGNVSGYGGYFASPFGSAALYADGLTNDGPGAIISGGSGSPALTVTTNSASGYGILVSGGSLGTFGVQATGGSGSGTGLVGIGGATNGLGVRGTGTGNGPGVEGFAGATSGTPGVRGNGTGTGAGLYGIGGTTNSSSGVVGVCLGTNCYGGDFLGSGNLYGVRGIGGGTSGTGVNGAGGAPNGVGVVGAGNGSGDGVQGTGGSSSGRGATFTGGSTNGEGVVATGSGTADGVKGTSGTTAGAFGVEGITGVSTGVGYGVKGSGGSATIGYGGYFRGNGSGTSLWADNASAGTGYLLDLSQNNTTPTHGHMHMNGASADPSSPTEGEMWMLDNGGKTVLKARLNSTNAIIGGNPLLIASTAAGQSIPNNAATIVVYGTSEADTDSAFNTGTGVFTTPTGKGGHYHIDCAIAWNAGFTAADVELGIYINGARKRDTYVINPAGTQTMLISAIVVTTASQTIDCRVLQNSGVAKPLFANADFNYLTIKRLSD